MELCAKWCHTTLALFACTVVITFPDVYASAASATTTGPARASDNTLVLLISFDGFRWDYLDLVRKAGRKTPNFDYLIKRGVKPKWVRPTFTTSTFPNHYSIATGMYQESHGMLGKEMFDPLLKETFSANAAESRTTSLWWSNGTEVGGPEPIWVTNQKDHRWSKSNKKWSGVMFWVGSNVMIHEQRPLYFAHYDRDFPFKLRIDSVLTWFLGQVTPINLGLLYFSEPDALGHEVGPNSPQMIDKIVELDALVGYLIVQLKEKDLFDRMNIIITSDHGLARLHSSIYIDSFVNPYLFKVYGSETVWNILPNEGTCSC